MLTEEQVREAAEQVLARLLASHGFVRAEVRSGFDHDGEPSFFIAAVFAPGSRRIGGELSNRALSAVSEALLARDEPRFPYLTNRYPDDERPEDGAAERRPAA